MPVVGGLKKGEPPPVVPAEDSRMTLAVDQANIASARALLGFLRGEIDPLALTQELENGAAHRAAVKEVFDSALIADESKPFVNQQTRDRAGWHTVPPVRGLANCPELGSSSPRHPFPDARRQLLATPAGSSEPARLFGCGNPGSKVASLVRYLREVKQVLMFSEFDDRI